MSSHDIEDAVGYAITDLLDYWVRVPTSIHPENPDRTFWYAVHRATLTGKQFLSQTLAGNAGIESLDALREQGVEMEAPAHPEVDFIDSEERLAAIDLLSNLDKGRTSWLSGALNGLTTREEAEREGVSHVAIGKRRRRAIEELRANARAQGVL